MANKIEIGLQLQTELKKGRSEIGQLKTAGAFQGKQGSQYLKKLEGLLTSLEAIDVNNLKGKELTKFLNELGRFRSIMDTASRSLTSYSEAVIAQQKVLDGATKVLDKAKSKRSTALETKNIALKRVKLDNHTYFNTETGRQVTNIDTIAKLLNSGQLQIRNAKGTKAVSQAMYEKILANTGIQDYANAVKDYEEAKIEVKNAEVIVDKAKDDLSKLPDTEGDIHPLTQSIAASSAETGQNITNIRDQVDQETQENIDETTQGINRQITALNKQESSLGKVFKQFSLYSIALKSMKKALREAVQTIKELDQSLTEQAMVTGMTREQAYGLIKDYQNLALEVGATTKEIAGVATEYMKQGKTIEDSLILTKAAVAAAKVARVSVGDSVNYLTTALNGFRLSAEDAMRVSDKFAAVAAASATDYDELAIALSKVASQANLAGMSIDYTTALLTKGLETTREAPETMGTALKTIIARMRELSDYGETLEGDTDINNVESQLKYVGIELRNTNGELRSTEDVLDELGRKWSALNTNQQAALAKALAGTRQQSRLIAMMDDYERVIELQEIAERSSGATSAQAATYLEGMAASLNKIQVGWEKIISSLTDSNVIVDTFSLVGWVLDKVGEFLSKDWGVVTTLTLVSTLLTKGLSTRIRENAIAKEQKKLEELKYKRELKARKLQLDELRTEIKHTAEDRKQTAEDEKQAAIAEANGDAAKIAAAEAAYTAKISEIELDTKEQLADLDLEEVEINHQLQQLGVERQAAWQNMLTSATMMGGALGSIVGQSKVWMILSTVISTALQTIPALIELANLKYKKLNKTKKEGATTSLIDLAASFFPVGLAVAAGLAAIAGIIWAMASSGGKAKNTSSKIEELSNGIYKLNESSTAIKQAASEFDNLDSKIIKTKEDLEAMKESMNSVADSIDWTVGGKYSEKEAEEKKKEYSEMEDPEAQRAYLEDIQKEIDAAVKDKREAQLDLLKKLSEETRNKLLEDDLAVLSAVRATNNAYLYEEIDELKKTSELTEEQMAATEDLGQRILSNLSAQEAYNWATEEGRKNIKALVTQLEQLNVGEILTSNDYNLSEQIDAYKKAYKSLEGDARDALREEFRALDTMANWDSVTIGLIEHLNLTADEVNNIAKAIQKLGFSSEESLFKFDALLKNISQSGDIQKSITDLFGAQIGSLDTDESKKLYNTILNAYAEATGVGILNMGQNLDKLNNTINDFYKKAAEWSTMSKAEQTQFLNDNAELFNNNADLLEAFESGNYQAIEEALKNSDALQEQVKDRIAEIEQEIALEKAKLTEDQNTAYIKMLEEELEYLNNSEELFEVSLETQLKQQEEQLNTYKEYLQEQKDALEDSLNKRKEAYEKYFDAINRDEEDEDYEEQANTLISNLSKLSSSTNADAKKQSKELENQLKELEEERLKTLRERAQEAIIENMDDTLDEINNKFDELINSNKALLAAMQGDLANGEGFLANLMTDKINNGATALELESFWKELESTYGSVLTGIDWDSFKASESGNSMFLNVNGQTIELSPGNQQSVYEVIMKALKQVGVS